MKKFIVLSVLLGITIFTAGCSVFEGRPEKNNVNQARGSWVWMNERLDEEQEANQLEGHFGDQLGANANDERPDAIELDPSFPGMKSN
jgi:hypothetical protein